MYVFPNNKEKARKKDHIQEREKYQEFLSSQYFILNLLIYYLVSLN